MAPDPASPSAATTRLSIVYFTGPHPDTVVECLPSCLPPAPGKPKYPPITARDHVQEKMMRATAEARAANDSE